MIVINVDRNNVEIWKRNNGQKMVIMKIMKMKEIISSIMK